MSNIPKAPLTAVQASPLDVVVHDAARKLLTLRMTRIVGAGDIHDAKNLNADLDVLAKIFDEVILAVGNYAQANIGITSRDVDLHFTDIVRDALEGSATFVVDEAGKQAQAYLNDTAFMAAE